MRIALTHTVAGISTLLAIGCTRTERPVPPTTASDDHRITIASANPGGTDSEDACDAAGEAWAIEIARKAIDERESPEDWPHGADYRLIRRSAVQWWIIARRITSHDPSGHPRFTEPWDRGIIIDELGNVMFYVPAK